MTIDFAFGEDRQDIVEFLDLLDFDSLNHRALRGQLGLPAFEVGDVNRIRLTNEPVDGRRGIQVLHGDLEAEVLCSLIADRLDHRIGHADVS